MAAYKETPRQQMISMMYLVLTAMLALNVSKEVVDAFVVVNESIEETNVNFDDKINEAYGKFAKQYQMNQEKVEPLWQSANAIRDLSNDMRTYLKGVRDTVMIKAEHKTMEELKIFVAEELGKSVDEIDEIPLSLLKSHDKYDETTNYFVPNVENPSKKGKAGEIRRKFEAYREQALEQISPEARDKFSIGPNFEATYRDANGKKEGWEVHNFYHTIMAADVTILNKLITEVNNAEFELLNHLYSAISEQDFKFSNIEAKVIPQKSYILLGEEYQADVLVAAYDTTQQPKVYIQRGVDKVKDRNKATLVKSTDDIVNLKLKGNSVGEHKYAGLIVITSPDGSENEYHFNDSYIVGKRSATVSATKMNVLYKGVDNPISISVPGVANSQLQPRINVGAIKNQGNGNYMVNIPGDADVNENANIEVYAKVDGKSSFFTNYEFRVKRIPNPTPTIGGAFSSGEVERNFMKAASIIAKKPEYFDFDYTFPVKGFVMWYQGTDGYWVDLRSTSHRFTPEMLALFDRLPTGSRITFENIRVAAPEGERLLKTNIAIKLR